MKLTNEFIPYEQALALKELRFDEPCFGKWLSSLQSNWKDYELIFEMGMNEEFEDNRNVYLLDGACSAPTFSQAFRWFREKYGLYYQIEVLKEDNGDIVFDFVIIEDSDDTEEYHNRGYLTYEEAELACLKKLIKISAQSKSENEELTPYIEYYSNGNVRVKGQKNSVGQREGIWEYFYPNGNIEGRIPYKEGKMDGIVELFYPSGNIYRRTPYVEGKEDGIAEEFDEQGNITETYLWKDGELIKTTKH
jgi:antitoxin component YwqK of YwqJK toxin-antitoxin module